MAGGCSTVRAQYSGVWFERNTMVVGSDHPIFPIQALKGTFWSWMSSCMGVTDEVLKREKKKEKRRRALSVERSGLRKWYGRE